METFNVKLKDGRIVQIRLFQPEDKERLVEMYESLSSDAVRWALPPYTRERLEEGWFRNLQHITAFMATKLWGMLKFLDFPIQGEGGQQTWSHIYIKTSRMLAWAPPCLLN